MSKNIKDELLRNVDYKDTTDLWRMLWDKLNKISKIHMTIYSKREMLEIFYISIESLFGVTSYFFKDSYKKNYESVLNLVKSRIYNKTFVRINEAYVKGQIQTFKPATIKTYESEYIFLRDKLITIFREMNEGLYEVLIHIDESKKEEEEDIYTW